MKNVLSLFKNLVKSQSGIGIKEHDKEVGRVNQWQCEEEIL